MTLHPSFRSHPLAHRGLHGPDRPENSRAAVEAAIEAGYGIEIDVLPSRDGRAMVFHDATLDRLTDETGRARDRDAADLSAIDLAGGAEGIPGLEEILSLIGGRVPVLIELKDHVGALGPTDGQLETAVAAALASYDGPVAVMSFNPNMVLRMADLAPNVARGLTTCDFAPEDWPAVPEERLAELRVISDYGSARASFVSHDARDLDRPRLGEVKDRGATILCWTIRSAEAEAAARRIAHNITFEGYLPERPRGS